MHALFLKHVCLNEIRNFLSNFLLLDLTNHFHKKSRFIHFIWCKSLCISGKKKDKINIHNNFVILQTYNQICLHIVLKIFFSFESIKIWQFKYARCFLFCLRRRLRYLVVANVFPFFIVYFEEREP